MKILVTGGLRFFLRLATRSAAGTAAGLIVMFWPLRGHVAAWAAGLQQPVGALLIVCFIGKALYDTLFYDRYRL